jgi:hypothetical protein
VAHDDVAPDYGLISPLAMSPDSRVPEGLTEGSSADEYDRYFRIIREHPGLLQWTRNCLDVEARVRDDLDHSGLSAEDRGRVLEGLLDIHRVTLERWLAAGQAAAVRTAQPSGPTDPAEEGR